jgi:hypothetical protein
MCFGLNKSVLKSFISTETNYTKPLPEAVCASPIDDQSGHKMEPKLDKIN